MNPSAVLASASANDPLPYADAPSPVAVADSPDAVAMARAIRALLDHNGVAVAPFAPAP